MQTSTSQKLWNSGDYQQGQKQPTEFYRPTEKGEQRERSGAMNEKEKATHNADRLGEKVGMEHQTSTPHSSLT